MALGGADAWVAATPPGGGRLRARERRRRPGRGPSRGGGAGLGERAARGRGGGGARTGRPRGATVHPDREHRRPRPPARGGLVARAPLLPMQIALNTPRPARRPDARRSTPSATPRRLWHLVQGAYADVEGHLPQSLEAWQASGMEKPGWDPELWIVRHDAKGIVGAVLGEQERAHRCDQRGRRRAPRARARPWAHAPARAPRGLPRERLRTPRPPCTDPPPRPRACSSPRAWTPARDRALGEEPCV